MSARKVCVALAMICVPLVAVCACDAHDDMSAGEDSDAASRVDAGDVNSANIADADAGDASDADTVPDPSIYADCAAYAVHGPDQVGVTTVEVDGNPVEIWYPAAPGATEGHQPDTYDLRDWVPADQRDKIPADAPTTFQTGAFRDVDIATGPFPVVLFSHGFAGYRMQSTAYTVHLASWGMVVAAPEHPERGLTAVLNNDIDMSGSTDVATLRATLDWLVQANGQTSNFFGGHLRTDKAGITGHSAGGRAALAASLADDRFVAVVGLAPAVGVGGQDPAGVNAPELLIAGSDDGIVRPRAVRDFYDTEPAPKAFVSIAGAGHLAFSDICLIGRQAGGILKIAQDSGIDVNPAIAQLARDGCRDDQLDPRAAWPVFEHFATAELRYALGLDARPIGLDDQAAQCFGDLIADDDFSSL